MSQPAVALSRLGQVALMAHDLARATAFYRDTLGMRFLFTAPPRLAFFDCGGVRLMLSEPEPGETFRTGSVLYFLVDDLPATWAALQARAVSAVHEPQLVARMPDHELWMAFLLDSEGNTLGLMSELRA